MSAKPLSPALKLLLDLGPLAVFFATYRFLGLTPEKQALIAATGALIAMTLLSLAVHYWKERKLAIMPLVTGVAVTLFGTLTIALDDELFIKMKPTIVNLIFASVLLGGLMFKRPMLKYLLESALHLDDLGWAKLSFRWGIYFIFLAGLNEFIWRSFPTDFWVNFKVFGMFTLTLLFTFAQLPLMKRHMVEEDAQR